MYNLKVGGTLRAITLCYMVLVRTNVQAQDTLQASYSNLPSLKKLSIEELFNVEVRSVSRVSENTS
jgi:hypothetical protein